MRTGVDLGRAIGEAIKKLELSQQTVADAFGVTQPSVSEWIRYGRIGKQHIPKLLDYFKDVAGPEHWGLPFSDDEFALVLAFRELHPATQQQALSSMRAAAAKSIRVRKEGARLVTIPGDLGVPASETMIPTTPKKPERKNR